MSFPVLAIQQFRPQRNQSGAASFSNNGI